MARIILSASLSLPADKSTIEVKPSPGVNILCGNNAEEIFWSLAGIVDIYSSDHSQTPTTVTAELRWSEGVTYGVTGKASEGRNQMVVDYVKGVGEEDPRYLVKRLHKQRYRDVRDSFCLFNGCGLDNPNMLSESDAILASFHSFIEKLPDQKNGRPVFLLNFLERLDRSVDILPFFEELAATGRQAFVLIPDNCTIPNIENAVQTVKI